MELKLPTLPGLLAFALVTVSATQAHAHRLEFEPDPAVSTYVLVGPVFGASWFATDSNHRVNDIGIEASVHHFLRNDHVATTSRFGIGALAQAEMTFATDGSGQTSSRFALGGQATFSIFGVQSGFYTRAGVPNFGDTFGAFVGGFVSLGIVSFAFQAELPIMSMSSGAPTPIVYSLVTTLKWPFEIRDASTPHQAPHAL